MVFLLQLAVDLGRTLRHMPLLVFLPALFITVLNILALADVPEDVFRAAVLAGSDDELLAAGVSE